MKQEVPVIKNPYFTTQQLAGENDIAFVDVIGYWLLVIGGAYCSVFRRLSFERGFASLCCLKKSVVAQHIPKLLVTSHLVLVSQSFLINKFGFLPFTPHFLLVFRRSRPC